MRTKSFITLLLAFTFIFSFNILQAQEHDEHHEDGHDDEHGDTHSEHHVSKHHAALFLGATTTMSEHSTTLFTAGLDYEFRLPFAHNMFGIGLGAEYLYGEEVQEFIFGVPIFIHPFAGVKLNVAPLYAMAGHEHVDHDGHTEVEWSNHFGFRGGLAYDIHLGKFSISPTFNADFFDGNVSLVYGLGFGLGF